MRRRIKDGTLAAAVLPDGKLDVDVADALLAGEVPDGKLVAVDLAEARRRKLLVTSLLLADEMIETDASMVLATQVEAMLAWDAKEIAGQCLKIADKARALAGISAAAASQGLDVAINEAMIALSSRKPPEPRRMAPRRMAPMQPETWFKDMSATDLLAWRTDAEAVLLKMKRDLKTGRAMRIVDVIQRLGQRNGAIRAKLFAMPGTVAPYFELMKSPAAAKRLVTAELKDILSELKTCERTHNAKS